MAQLLAFVAICISSLVIYVGFFAHPASDPSRLRYLLATLQIREFSGALERYRADCGDYPSVFHGLSALVLNEGAQGWKGPYLKNVPLDPWYQPYIYLRSSESAVPEVLSYGADHQPGGELFNADISSLRPQQRTPNSPIETTRTLIFFGIWFGAWFCFVASIVVLMKTSRPQRSS